MSHQPVMKYVLKKAGPKTTYELRDELEISTSAAKQAINLLHMEGKVHIEEWRLTENNQFAAVWAHGKGKDAPKPVIEKPAPKPRRYRSPAVVKALATQIGNPFATAMWNVAQVSGERG